MTEQTVDIPAKGTWTFDTNHTVLGAVARHLMVTKVRGRFSRFDGKIHVGDSPDTSWVELNIDAASIDTGVADRDQHLRSPDFLDVERHPHITFRSTKVEQTGPTTLRVTGDLTIRSVTQPVPLDVEYNRLTQNP
jgi:polyisoprenoid-binding protein YceI